MKIGSGYSIVLTQAQAHALLLAADNGVGAGDSEVLEQLFPAYQQQEAFKRAFTIVATGARGFRDDHPYHPDSFGDERRGKTRRQKKKA